MDPAISQLITVFVGEMVMLPVLLFVIKHFIGRKLDDFDEKREQARKEQKSRERYRDTWEKALSEGIKSLLRSEIISTYHKARDRGYASLETKEYIERVYVSYSNLNGNGLGKSMYESIMEMPTEPPEEHGHEEEHHEF